jgi:DNA-binding IclR family transcriptional regulator
MEVVCTVAVPEEDDIVIMGLANASLMADVNLSVGMRIPFAPPYGIVVMAWADEQAIAKWLDKLRDRDRDEGRYRQALEAIRERGYSMSLNLASHRRLLRLVHEVGDDVRSEHIRATIDQLLWDLGHEGMTLIDFGYTDDVVHLSAPVFGADGKVVATLHMTDLKARPMTVQLVGYVERLVAGAAEVTRAIGGSPPGSDHAGRSRTIKTRSPM